MNQTTREFPLVRVLLVAWVPLMIVLQCVLTWAPDYSKLVRLFMWAHIVCLWLAIRGLIARCSSEHDEALLRAWHTTRKIYLDLSWLAFALTLAGLALLEVAVNMLVNVGLGLGPPL